MTLYLVQHGEACAKDVDPERPLTVRGRADIERLAGFLERAGVRVGRVIHSGKRRAEQTAELLAAAIAPEVTPVARAGLGPNDDPGAIDWEAECAAEDILVVGHLPFMAKLVARLVAGDEDRLLTAYQPGSVVRLEFGADRGWQISGMIRPDMLPSQ